MTSDSLNFEELFEKIKELEKTAEDKKKLIDKFHAIRVADFLSDDEEGWE